MADGSVESAGVFVLQTLLTDFTLQSNVKVEQLVQKSMVGSCTICFCYI